MTKTAIPSGRPEGVGYDIEAVRKDFPILCRHGARRTPAGLPGQRGDLAEADRRAGRDRASTTSSTTRTSHRGIHVLAEEATALYEGARDKVAAFIGAPSRDEIVFTKNSSEAINLVAYAFGTGVGGVPRAEAGRRGGDLRDGAPLEHRPVADALRAHRRDAALVPHHRRGPPRPDRPRRAGQRAHQDRRLRAPVEHPRHDQPGLADHRRGRARSARWCCWTPPSRCRTCPWTSPSLAWTSSPSPATRCARPPASACCGRARSCSRRCRRSWAAAR